MTCPGSFPIGPPKKRLVGPRTGSLVTSRKLVRTRSLGSGSNYSFKLDVRLVVPSTGGREKKKKSQDQTTCKPSTITERRDHKTNQKTPAKPKS